MFSIEKWDNDVEKYTITCGEYSASIISLGAILQSFCLKDCDVVLGYNCTKDYLQETCFLGQVVGPFANRIKNACFKLNDKTYNLEKNDNSNCLHSGSANFGRDIWTLKDYSENSVTLQDVSGCKGGFDQTFTVSVTYTIEENGNLSIEYKAATDRKAPLNITNHAYFNLGGGDIRQSSVQFNSKGYLATDKELIPTEVQDCKNTAYDFTEAHKIIERNNGEYDTCILLDNGPVVVENNGLRLSMSTDMPAFQFYTGIHLTGVSNGKYGKPYSKFEGFALESEFYPDFVNRSDFKGCFIDKGDVFTSKTTYKLEKI